MNFDPTITWGAVFIVISQILSMFWFASRMDKRIDLLTLSFKNLSDRVDAQGDKIEEYGKTGERFATVEGRVTNHGQMLAIVQRDISDLRRGAGWITAQRTSVDGEYK